jgi:hypothetical protein
MSDQSQSTSATSVLRPRSQELFARAQQCIPGGVNSPVRAFRGVGGDPVFFVSGQGPSCAMSMATAMSITWARGGR